MNKWLILVLLGIGFSVAIYVLDSLEQCRSPLETICYKYITSGGLFGGIEERRVSCEKEHDFYILQSSDWTNCKPIYKTYYEEVNRSDV